MAWNPNPTLGGALWTGNVPLVTARQLASTISNINISTMVVSTFSTLITSSMVAGFLSSQNANINNISANTFYLDTGSAKNLAVSSLLISSFVANSINTSTGVISSLSLNALDMNNNFITEFRGATSNSLSTMTLTSGNKLELNANSGIDIVNDLGANVGYNSEVNITSQFGAGTRVNITADEASVFSPTPSAQVNILAKGNESIAGFSFGGKVNITAEAGSGTNAGLGFGGIDLTAYSQGTSPGTIKLSGGSNLIYSGPTSPFVGIYGQNFIYGSLGNAMVSGTPPTLPTLVGTNYFYGALGAGGHTLAIVANRFQGGVGIDFLQPFPLSDLYIQGSLNGTDLIVIKSVRSLAMANSGPITGVGNLGVSSINNNRVFVGIPSSFSNVSISTSAMSVSSINGGSYPPSFPSDVMFNTVITKSLTTSTINGAPVFTGIPASFTNTSINTSSLTTSSINGQAVFTGIPSSLATSTITAGNLNAGAITASSISCITNFTVSSINGLPVGGSTVIPSSLATSTITAGTINASSMGTSSLTTLTINGLPVFTGIPSSLATSTITAGSINASSIGTSSLTTLTINGLPVFTGIPSSLATSTITAGDINASSIGTSSLTTLTINGQPVFTGIPSSLATSTITAGNLTATSISCITNLTVSSINGLAPGGGGSSGIPSTISTMAILTSSILASTITSRVISTTSLTTSSMNSFALNTNIITPGYQLTFGNDASTILIETPIFLTRFNGLNLSYNRDYTTLAYTSSNTNRTIAWSNSIESIGGDTLLASSASTLRLYGDQGIVLDGGDVRFDANNLNMANGNIYSTGNISTNTINVGNINVSTINGATAGGIPAVLSTSAVLTSSLLASTINTTLINTPFVSTTTVSTLRLITQDAFVNGNITMIGDLLGGVGSDVLITQGSLASARVATISTSTSTINGFTTNLSCLPSGIQAIISIPLTFLASSQALNVVCGTASFNLPSGTYVGQCICPANQERSIQFTFGWSQVFQTITPFETLNNLGNGNNKVVAQDNGGTGFRVVNYTIGGGDSFTLKVYFVAGRSNDSRQNFSGPEFITTLSSPTLYDNPVIVGCSSIIGSSINLLTNNDISIQAGPYSTPTFLGGGSIAIEATSEMLIAGAYSATLLSAGPVLIASEDEVAIFASTNAVIYSPAIGLVAESTVAIISPDVYVSTNCNNYHIMNVRQPFIQYGAVSTSGGSGSMMVTLDVPYSSITSYQAFIAMEDSSPAQTSVVKNTVSTITLYWSNGGGGTHALSWNTMGNLACEGGGGGGGGAAYDLVNNIYGNSQYGTWSPYGAPDYSHVYLEQSADGSTGWTIYDDNIVYTSDVGFYSLPENYYYRFYVVSYYSGTPYTSANSSAEYVFPM